MRSEEHDSRPTICLVAASPLTIKAFLVEHIKGLAKIGKVEILSAFDNQDLRATWPDNVVLRTIYIPRAISPLFDCIALIRLWSSFRKIKPDLVFSITAKTGLLAMAAASLARVPVRIHCFTGQAWAERKGLSRMLLKNADRLTAGLATSLLADSPTQRDFLESQGVVSVGSVSVPAHGSISGVDTQRFKPDPEVRKFVRTEFGLNADDLLILFLARVKRSKGVIELIQAFDSLATKHPNLYLAIVGPDEEKLDAVLPSLVTSASDRVHRISSFVADHQKYLAAADIFCLPSHYEGFGSVVIEAGACGLPTVAARVYGLADAVKEGVTGLLHNPGDVPDLTTQLKRLVEDKELRQKMGDQARLRSVSEFEMNYVVNEYLCYIKTVLGHHRRIERDV